MPIPAATASPRASWNAWLRGLLLVAPVLALTARFVAQNSYSLYDDTFIYFRYVENVFHGCALRFNCADAPVEGFTSPLYLAVLSLARLVSPDLRTLTQVLGALCTAAGLSVAVLTADDARLLRGHPRLSFALAACVSLALALDHVVLLNAVTGMETALAVLVTTLLLRALLLERHRWVPWLCVLAWLCRPEEALFLVVLPIVTGRARWRLWIAPFAAAAAVELGRVAVFHDLLPNTYYAKSGGTLRHVALGVDYLRTVLREAPLIALAPLALAIPHLRRAVAGVLAVTALLFVFFLRSGGDAFLYSRLPAPLVPTLVLLAMHGACALALRLREPWGARVSVAVLALCTAYLPLDWRSHRFAPTHGLALVDQWGRLGRWLRANHPRATVAVVPIGAIAYYSDARVIDLVGLTSREIAHARRGVPPERLRANWIGHERHDTEYVLGQRPDLIIFTRTRTTPWRDLAETRAGFWAEWLLLREIKAGRAPYVVDDAALGPREHVLMFRRIPGP